MTTMRGLIQNCQISGRICKRLMSARSVNDQPLQVLEIVDQFDKELVSWKKSLPIAMRPKDCPKESPDTPNEKSLAEVLISSSYYDLLMVLHAPFAYPWLTARFSCGPNIGKQMQLNTQVARSTEIVVAAARNIIMMARLFEINGANTHAYAIASHFPLLLRC